MKSERVVGAKEFGHIRVELVRTKRNGLQVLIYEMKDRSTYDVLGDHDITVQTFQNPMEAVDSYFRQIDMGIR